ncbi:A predicted alpha-helical domain with a conserved ER motif family protein [Collimonas arenae]|uniref:A predicted alpha-helical domain with a conserved ER motif family protein n=1 Tax=Collimonas arenae TaxID=279058 RepID=A0A127PV72_9BURK|nr:alpha-E domain-containing protein [Collimonas arenae]AMP01687.1 A predicted alpha-helical domain with a conserved ER motif family protein [Collimonas arenae]AMP11583.1 A predicted alpha-helical domain with a conserved ER motif family protein [Collimonas arenae]
MLSRTADHLFWMSRYTERAENTARMLDVHVQTGLLPQSVEDAEKGWRAILGISELQQAFDKKYSVLTQKDVIDFMVRDPSNPSSIASCLKQARENARAVRGALTTEAWEIQNATWIKMQGYLQTDALEQNPSEFFEWVKHRSHLSRGVTIGTMLKDEAFHFIRLGTFLERADNTARIIDVKFHGAKEGAAYKKNGQQQVQSKEQQHAEERKDAIAEPQVDFYYWAAILRSVSGFEIYRKVYRDVITPARVADLLILRPDMPRSLLACMEQVVGNLKHVRNDISSDTERFAGKLHADLKFSNLDEILDAGLHDYLTRFFERVFELGNRISRDFLVPLNT